MFRIKKCAHIFCVRNLLPNIMEIAHDARLNIWQQLLSRAEILPETSLRNTTTINF